MTQLPPADAQKVAALRELLPATGAGIYLDTATAGPLPAETATAMREADDWELRVGRAAAGREEDVEQREEEARAVVAALIGADPAEVGLAAGLLQALEAGLWSVDWRPGDGLAASRNNQPEVLRAVELFARRLDLRLQLSDGPEWEAMPAGRLVVLPHVAHDTGRLLQVAPTAERLRRQGVRLLLDVSLSAGALPMAVTELTADVVVLATDRWALGPEATAAVWHAGRAAARVAPGGLPRTTLLGLARSVGWLEMYVGLEWAFERTAALTRRLAAGLAACDGVELLAPLDDLAAIVSFRLPGAWSAEVAADELGRRVFAILRPLPQAAALRASVAWYNTEDEVERFVAAVAELARHTPENLPRRPALTVL